TVVICNSASFLRTTSNGNCDSRAVKTPTRMMMIPHVRNESSAHSTTKAELGITSLGFTAHDGAWSTLERLQKLENRVLILFLQLVEFLGHMHRLAPMTPDGIAQCQRFSIVHEPHMQAHSPQWNSSNLVSAALEILLRKIIRHHREHPFAIVLRGGLQDPVS